MDRHSRGRAFIATPFLTRQRAGLSDIDGAFDDEERLSGYRFIEPEHSTEQAEL